MADISTVARPYAKAIFEMARDAKKLQNWDDVLNILAIISKDPAVVDFVQNPTTSFEQRVDLFVSVVANYNISVEKQHVVNFLTALVENNRLLALPDIHFQYAQHRAAFEKSIEVQVVSYSPLTDLQQEKLIAKLAAKLQRDVKLQVEIDKSLKGGAIIRAGHLVFDASVGTQINKLGGVLTA